MTFIEKFDQEFEHMLVLFLEGQRSDTQFARWASERVLESYRNGITAGRNGVTVKRHGDSRRRGADGKARAAETRRLLE